MHGVKTTFRWYHGLFLAWVFLATIMFLWPRPEPGLGDEPKHLCEELTDGAYGYFGFGVDTDFIRFDRERMLLSDSRTGFQATDVELLRLCKRCESEIIDSDGGFVVVKLCDVVFVVGRDFRILSIMDPEVFEASGEQFLAEIRTELSVSSVSVPPIRSPVSSR